MYVGRDSGFTVSANRATLAKRPGHCHSIVCGTCKHLNDMAFLSGRTGFTVGYTVEKSRLRAIGTDRCRKQSLAHGARV